MTQVKSPIPKLLRIGEKKYSVEVVEAMLEKSWQGSIAYGPQRIKIARTSNVSGRPFANHEMQATFWHEITHAILYDMDNSLYKNEKFVTEFSTRLAQAIKTARF
jgi:hypothetical protein